MRKDNKEGRVDNDTYYNLGLSSEEKRDLVRECINRENENMEKSNGKEGQRERMKKESKVDTIIRGAVAGFALAAIAFMFIFGADYIKGRKGNKALKEKTTINKELLGEDTKHMIEECNYEFPAQNSYTHYYKGKADFDYEKLKKTAYEKNGKLKEGYEEYNITVPADDGKTRTITLVGKDFIRISMKQSIKNMKYWNEYMYEMSYQGKEEYEKYKEYDKGLMETHFKSDRVYFILNDTLVRVICNKNAHMDADNCYVYESLEEKNGMVYALRSAATKYDGFWYRDDITAADDEFMGMISDVNILEADVLTFVDKKNDKEIKKEKAIDFEFLNSKNDYENMICYYIDVNHDLWRIDNVEGLTENGGKLTPDDCGDVDVWYVGKTIKVNLNCKAKKIAHGVYMNHSLQIGVMKKGQKIAIVPFDDFEKYHDDKNLSYKGMDDDYSKYGGEW